MSDTITNQIGQLEGVIEELKECYNAIEGEPSSSQWLLVCEHASSVETRSKILYNHINHQTLMALDSERIGVTYEQFTTVVKMALNANYGKDSVQS